MQGRLSFPIDNKIQYFPKNKWQDEFKEAASCNFACIEWIFDTYEKNPIMDDSKITARDDEFQFTEAEEARIDQDAFDDRDASETKKSKIKILPAWKWLLFNKN